MTLEHGKASNVWIIYVYVLLLMSLNICDNKCDNKDQGYRIYIK